jgi:hypothetical protein
MQRLFANLHTDLTAPSLEMLINLTIALLEGADANIRDLADTLPDLDSPLETREQRLRRFMSSHRVTPLATLDARIELLRPVLEILPAITLSMDRTEWKKRQRWVNTLMVSLTFEGRAIPLYWKVWDQKGNSSFDDWKDVLAPVITTLQSKEWLADRPIEVTADREFGSPQLSQWLKTQFDVDSILRIKKSQYLGDGDVSEKLAHLLDYFPKGATQSYPNVTITKENLFRMNVTITWDEKYEEPLIIASTLDKPRTSLNKFEKRFYIEPMFKDCKSNGFNIEKTKMNDPKRIETLWTPISFAYIFCIIEGYRKEKEGEVKPKKIRGKMIRQTGLFLIGLREFKKKTTKATLIVFRKFINQIFNILQLRKPLII